MSIAARRTRLWVHNMRTRMPFRYGIATLTALPHLFVRLTFEIDGRAVDGLAAEGLPPKWFTKDPATSFEQDVEDMLAVIRGACRFAEQAGACASVFELWHKLYATQHAWAEARRYPPLLASFGASVVERAAIDAWCKAKATTFADGLRCGGLGFDAGAIHPQLVGIDPASLLPAAPRPRIAVRHTVGLSDPLTDAEIDPGDRVDDGLPHSLAACIAGYRLRYLKIKLGGDEDVDRQRLRAIATLLRQADAPITFTLDGNEQYPSVAAFRAFWDALGRDQELADMLRRLIVVEQPLHRDVALAQGTAEALRNWPDRPPIIIDESDGELGSLRVALESGYVGTSHKNCKGVFKGVANACLLAHRRHDDAGRRFVLTGEDLANVGPVALLQDLAVMASLGLEHVERNGHHYFRGLGMLPGAVQRRVLERHGDLYRADAAGVPTLDIRDGQIDLASVLAAPFGCGMELDTGLFQPLADWRFASLHG